LTHRQLILFLSLIASAVLLLAAAFIVLSREESMRNLRTRVRHVAGARIEDDGAADHWGPYKAVSLLAGIGEWLRRSGRLYSAKDIDVLESILAAGGLDARRVLPLVLGFKLLFLVTILAGGVTLGIVLKAGLVHWLMMIAMALPTGIMVPELALRLLQRSHKRALRRGIPDVLDMLVVCTEAGLALESALEQVAAEIRTTNPAMSVTMANFLNELRILPDRREAFANLGSRSGVDGLRRMGTMMMQTLQLGTPLAQSLRAMAVELRREQMIRLEEKAVQLPTLLVFPLIFCILPVLLITLVGPSILTLIDMLKTVQLQTGT
jgi:tight adherence protein C